MLVSANLKFQYRHYRSRYFDNTNALTGLGKNDISYSLFILRWGQREDACTVECIMKRHCWSLDVKFLVRKSTLYVHYTLTFHIYYCISTSGRSFLEFRKEKMYRSFSLYSQERMCCAGYYGVNCEKCPGSEGQPCFGNGVCVDGINGTGVCQCNQGFNGTACESCQAGKYGIHCDQGIV